MRFRDFASTDPGMAVVHDASRKMVQVELSGVALRRWVETSVSFAFGVIVGLATAWVLSVLPKAP
jgi:hypothetical protein